MKVEKVFLEQPTSERKVTAYVPYYRPLKVTKCSKCRNVIGAPDELIKIVKQPH